MRPVTASTTNNGRGGHPGRADMLHVGASDRLADLPCLDAGGADLHVGVSLSGLNAHTLEVGHPAALGVPVGVTHIAAHRGLLTADFADLRHSYLSLPLVRYGKSTGQSREVTIAQETRRCKNKCACRA